MPRRTFDDDDDLPRRPRRRSRDDDDDLDDRPRTRSRYRDDDFDDDDYPARKKQDSNLPALIAVGSVIAILALVGVFAGVYFTRAKPAPPPQPNFAGPAVDQPAPFIPPGVPKDILPPEIVKECVISNLRLSGNGFAGQSGLTFECEFPGGRPFGGEPLVAVVTAPNQPPVTAHLNGFMNAKDTITLRQIGAFTSFPRGTTVYIGKGFGAGFNSAPKPISNTLTLQ